MRGASAPLRHRSDTAPTPNSPVRGASAPLRHRSDAAPTPNSPVRGASAPLRHRSDTAPTPNSPRARCVSAAIENRKVMEIRKSHSPYFQKGVPHTEHSLFISRWISSTR
ncbi:MAG: hypothetical protein SOR67_01645 [Alloprevotella sp.]|nr:hypothetical protein [Alloprevotella sp.]